MNLGQQMSLIATKLGLQFTLHNKSISAEEVFSETGLLPAILRRADQLSSFCLGHGLGISFDEFSQGLLGVRVRLDGLVPTSLRVLCTREILQELIDGSTDRKNISLDVLMYD